MKPAVALAFGLFFLYAVWAVALSGLLASTHGLGGFVPDLGLVLLFAWAARLRGSRAPLAALLLALARASFSADPPLAVAAAELTAVGLFLALGAGLEVDRAFLRAFLCGVGAWLSSLLLVSARSLALAGDTLPLSGQALLPGALATGLACLVLAPLATRLAGLAPLAKVRP
ncbi:MAG: hypothetical protein ABL998_21065 [Planctomycetota bacterium]